MNHFVPQRTLFSYSAPFFLFAILGFALMAFMPVATALAASEAGAVPAKAVSEIAPVHLKIPKIKVDTVIKAMGLTPEGAMAVPGNRTDVGWFSLGTRPGDTGSAVIGGHNRWDSRAAVFSRLDQLRKGDVLSVVDASGVSISFVVRSTHTYDATDSNSGIFESHSGQHLNLITCSGVWNPLTKDYTKRLVVFTDALLPAHEIALAPITM